MTFAKPLSRLTWAMAAVAFLATSTNLHAQRSGSKSANVELTTIPTVPYEMVDKVAFFIHADPTFFTLDDLRRYGGNIKIIKDGERLEAMKYFSLGKEVQIVDDMPTCIVDVALGPDQILGEPNIKSGTAKGSDVKTYWAEFAHELPVRITISDANGNIIDGWEETSTNQIRYGNEKVATMESGVLGGFSYTSGMMTFDSPMEVRNELRGYEGTRFVRRKAVLMQMSKVIDEMEERLFFIDTKQKVNVYVGKGKHDYTELETAQETAVTAYKEGNFDALDAPIATWNAWLEELDFVDKKAKVTKKVALGLHLNLATAHLYRNEFGPCGAAISAARGLAVGDQSKLNECDELVDRLLKRRRSQQANPGFEMPSEEAVEREKAPDFKSAIGKRSQNKDVAMILAGDRYSEVGDLMAQWEAEALSGSAESAATETAEMTMEQRLGAKLTGAIGGVSLILSPFTDGDLVGQPLPAEVLSIPKLVYLDISGMKVGALPANIDELSMLQTLVVSNNDLTELPATLANIPTLKRVVARNNSLTSVPEGMELIPELKVIDLKGNPFDDGAKVSTIRRFGEDTKIKLD